MKWASLPLLALVLSAPLCDRAVSQTASTPAQNRQRVNENVLFLMGGQPGATFNQIANDISVVLGDGYNLRVLSVDGGAAVQNVEDVLYLAKHRHGANHPGGTELSKEHRRARAKPSAEG